MYSKIIKDSSLVSIQGVHSRKKKGRSVKKGGQTVSCLCMDSGFYKGKMVKPLYSFEQRSEMGLLTF